MFVLMLLLQFDDVLGRGAFKTVFKAFDSKEGTEVAWNKVLLGSVVNGDVERRRLFSEIHVLKRLKHKNIMTFHDYWLDDKNKTLNFITELFTHGSLKKCVRAGAGAVAAVDICDGGGVDFGPDINIWSYMC